MVFLFISSIKKLKVSSSSSKLKEKSKSAKTDSSHKTHDTKKSMKKHASESLLKSAKVKIAKDSPTKLKKITSKNLSIPPVKSPSLVKTTVVSKKNMNKRK